MDTDSSRNHSAAENSPWPVSAMLLWGTFGRHDPAGRRYHNRTALALAAMIVALIVSGELGLDPITAVVPGAAFLYIAYEFRKYLAAMDELARRLLLESIAWTYLCAGVGSMFLAGIVLTYRLRFHPIWVISAFAVLEPVRAACLYFVSRRYR